MQYSDVVPPLNIPEPSPTKVHNKEPDLPHFKGERIVGEKISVAKDYETVNYFTTLKSFKQIIQDFRHQLSLLGKQADDMMSSLMDSFDQRDY